MAGYVTVTRDCEVLRLPSPDAEVIGFVARGGRLILLRDDDPFYYRVAYDGQVAYVEKGSAALGDVAREALADPPAPPTTPAATTPAQASSAVGPGRAEWVRVIADCDAIGSSPSPDQPTRRIGAGSELPRVQDPAPNHYRVVFEGQLLYLPRAAAVPFHGDLIRPARVVQPRTKPRRRGASWFVTLLRVVGLVAGLNLWITGLVLSIFATFSVLDPVQDIGAGVGIGFGAGLALGFGYLLFRFTVRPFLQAALAITGIVFAFAGAQLLLLSVPAFQMSGGFTFDAERARVALPTAGGLLVVIGITTVAVVLYRWLTNAESRARWPDVVRWTAVIYGGLLALGTASSPISLAGGGDNSVSYSIQDAALAGAILPLTLLPGAILLYHGLTMRRDRRDGPFRFLPSAFLLGAFAAAIALGAIAVALDDSSAWLMTGAHAGAALLPAGALIALASRGGLFRSTPIAGVSHRQVWVALAVGIVVVTVVAGTIDGIIAQAFASGLLAWEGAFEGLRTLGDAYDVLRFADFYLSRGGQVVLLVFVVVIVAPVMEEGFKGLGAALLVPRTPSPSAALTIGVAVGAGFGVTEASLYGLGGVSEGSPIDWWALMLLRGGATSMHALNTGLLGLALYYDRAEGRFRRALALYGAAVLFHGLWNGLAVLAGSRVIFEFQGLTDEQLSWVSFGVMMALALGTFALLYTVARRAYAASEKVETPAATPPASPPNRAPAL